MYDRLKPEDQRGGAIIGIRGEMEDLLTFIMGMERPFVTNNTFLGGGQCHKKHPYPPFPLIEMTLFLKRMRRNQSPNYMWEKTQLFCYIKKRNKVTGVLPLTKQKD
mmetsp:Transcript_22496/g.27486  ORF Transcript_22496/g.27486 Transcript_22496/m.27486 type:complete len:106 (+) Transcript_22496:1357-1674(+)